MMAVWRGKTLMVTAIRRDRVLLVYGAGGISVDRWLQSRLRAMAA
jgi:hypothetical protein